MLVDQYGNEITGERVKDRIEFKRNKQFDPLIQMLLN